MEEQPKDHSERIAEIRREWHEWRAAALEQLPGILARLCAIKGKAYPGYGFHYSLVQSFYHTGHMIAGHLSLTGENVFDVPTTAQVLLEDLVEQIEAAEKYIQEHGL